MVTRKAKIQKPYNSKEVTQKLAPDIRQELSEYFVYFLVVFVAVTLTYLFIRTSVFDVIGISGKSMYPTFDNRDAIYIDQLSPKFSEYKRGDVVVLLAPEDLDGERSLYIKRIIGLPGEKVILDGGRVYIENDQYPNGVELLESDYLKPEVKTYKRVISGGERYEEEVLGINQYYVIGDNRTGSTDSRYFGSVEKRDILGKEFYRIIPPQKAGLFNPPTYNISN